MKSARISNSTCPVKSAPERESESSSELLFGEPLLVQEQTDSWSRIKTLRDGYEGYIEVGSYEVTDIETTHQVSTRATYIFKHADIKSSIVSRLLFNSELTVVQITHDGQFLELRNGGYVWAKHCVNAGVSLSSGMVEIGRHMYLNAPYRWGGRSADGCDCSGLVQMIARAHGVDLPRDSIDQVAALDVNVEFEQRQAEDLVFWPGHVGILETPDSLFHATAYSMHCCFEPLQQVIKRAGSPVAVKRLN